MVERDIITIAAMVILILFSAFFSATETAFTSASRSKLTLLADKKDKSAILVLKLLDNYDSLISTILIGNNIVNILSASICTLFFVKHLGDHGTVVSTAVMTVAVLIFGEISPKNMAKRKPERFAIISAPVIRALIWLLYPLNYVFSLWNKLLIKLFGSEDDRRITDEELLTIVEEACEDGTFGKQQSDLICSAIEFEDQKAANILTPRVDVTSVPLDIPLGELNDTFRESGFSRLPVYGENIDDVVGIIHQKDVCYMNAQDFDLSCLMKKPLFTTPNARAADLLRILQKEKSHMAIVNDEYGGMIGIITLEDIIEEIVGDIWDEYDEVVSDIVKLGDDKYRVSGSASIEKIAELFDDEVDDESVTTFNGWIIGKFGRIPEAGEKISVGEYEVEIIEATEKMVKSAIIERVAAEEKTGEEKAAAKL
ncbi:MAG: hemolysin family protein [Firmicutes bacterium]|nr:hemolysin family protein [Bacillota bacterium]